MALLTNTNIDLSTTVDSLLSEFYTIPDVGVSEISLSGGESSGTVVNYYWG